MKELNELLETDFAYMKSNLEKEFAAMAGKQLLITGGAGFLGYYLIQSVLYWNKSVSREDQIKITVYDNFFRGTPPWFSVFQKNNMMSFVKHNITDDLPKDAPRFDYIIHAAGIASPSFYRKHPIETIDANVNGLRILLDYCRKQSASGQGIEGLMFFSSSEIYGDPPKDMIPTKEDFRGFVSCTGPRACYDESKRFGETLCVNFANQFDLPIRMVRPFNNYGPGLKITDRRVIPDFANDVHNGRNIVMLSDGSPTRTFCYIADAIIGYYKVLIKGLKGEAYNIGIEHPEISMMELAEKTVSTARRLFGYQGKIVKQFSQSKDYLIDNPNRRCPDIQKARSQLGYDPKILIDEGLERSLTWYYYYKDNSEET